MPKIWKQPDWIHQTQIILNSYEHWLGKPLIPRLLDPQEEARQVYLAPQVVVSHGIEADPVLNFGNQTALELWEMNLETFTQTPSRETAESVCREERARMLQSTQAQGFIDNYQGIRISSTGRRFQIPNAIIWNLIDNSGQQVGQAATFSQWKFL